MDLWQDDVAFGEVIKDAGDVYDKRGRGYGGVEGPLLGIATFTGWTLLLLPVPARDFGGTVIAGTALLG